MKTTLLRLAAVLVLSAACTPWAESASKPNLLLIYVDNLGYGDLGCYGNIGIQTPRMDQLAGEGVRCTDFYVAAPTCTVSRGAILTGRHPLRNGLVRQALPALTGSARSPYNHFVAHLGGAAALREGRLKIVRPDASAPWELYDLAANPVESVNLAARKPDDLQRLTALYDAWEADVKHDASEPAPYRTTATGEKAK